jgi:hypothetical protein
VPSAASRHRSQGNPTLVTSPPHPRTKLLELHLRCQAPPPQLPFAGEASRVAHAGPATRQLLATDPGLHQPTGGVEALTTEGALRVTPARPRPAGVSDRTAAGAATRTQVKLCCAPHRQPLCHDAHHHATSRASANDRCARGRVAPHGATPPTEGASTSPTPCTSCCPPARNSATAKAFS